MYKKKTVEKLFAAFLITLAFSVLFSLFSYLKISSMFASADEGIFTAKQSNENRMLCVGGMPFGIKMYTKGVVVAGLSEIETADRICSPAKDAGIMVGDVILKLNGISVNRTDELAGVFEKSDGKEVLVTLIRDGKEMQVTLIPQMSKNDGKFKAGMWVKDNAAGIGTVTFVDPESKIFGGLGHGIVNRETGTLIPLDKGMVFKANINGAIKGEKGIPGELKGSIEPKMLGKMFGNFNCGVFGTYEENTEGMKKMQVASKDEIKTGDAIIYCTVENNKVGEYKAQILKVNDDEDTLKNFIIKITDERLLSITGGIVQGMSGSPVIQNGKLVGAVTHVLVNDPQKGYGIFIENMLKHPKTLVG